MNFIKKFTLILACCGFIFCLQNCQKEEVVIEEKIELTEEMDIMNDAEFKALLEGGEAIKEGDLILYRTDGECCENVSLTVEYTQTSSGNPECCAVKVSLNDPEGCTDGKLLMTFANFPNFPPQVRNNVINIPALCPWFGDIIVSVADCPSVSQTISAADCNKDACCFESFDVSQEEDPNNPGCCLVTVVDPCGDELAINGQGPNGPFFKLATGGSYTFSLCEGEEFQVEDQDGCVESTDWMAGDCTDCCDSEVEIWQSNTGTKDCRIYINIEGCIEGFHFEHKWGASGPLQGNFNFFDLNDNDFIRVFNDDCGYDTGWIGCN